MSMGMFLPDPHPLSHARARRRRATHSTGPYQRQRASTAPQHHSTTAAWLIAPVATAFSQPSGDATGGVTPWISTLLQARCPAGSASCLQFDT